MADFTPTSGFSFDSHGSIEVGMEIFSRQGAADQAVRAIDLPEDIKSLQIFGGSVAMRPRDPSSGTFGSLRTYKADGLFRLYLENPNDNKRIMLISIILKTTAEPQSSPVQAFTFEIPSGYTKAVIEMGSAGASGDINMEFQACGFWRR